MLRPPPRLWRREPDEDGFGFEREVPRIWDRVGIHATCPIAMPTDPSPAFSFIDADLPAEGKEHSSWVRLRVSDLPDVLRERGFLPAYATIQRFCEPRPREGEPHLCGLFFDFDDEKDPERARLDAVKLVRWFVDTAELPQTAFRVDFSGSKGVHVTIDPAVFAMQGTPDLTVIVGRAACWLADRLGLTTLDRGVYTRRRMWRLVDTRHPKTGLYCVEISVRELLDSNISSIRALAAAPRGPLYADEDRHREESDVMAAWFATFVEAHEAECRNRPTGDIDYDGIEVAPLGDEKLAALARLIAPHYAIGRRHHISLALAGVLVRAGVPEKQILAVVRRLAQLTRADVKAALQPVRSTLNRRGRRGVISGFRALSELLPEDVLARVEDLLARPCEKVEQAASPRRVTIDDAQDAVREQTRDAWGRPGVLSIIRFETGAGKTHGVIREAIESRRPKAIFAREHALLDQSLEVARSMGASAAKWPELNDETCPEGQTEVITKLYERDFNATAVVCGRCPIGPAKGRTCPRISQMREASTALIRLIPLAAARPSGPRLTSELGRRKTFTRGADVVIDENPAGDLTRTFVVTRRKVRLFRELFDEVLNNPRRRRAASFDVYRLANRVREATEALVSYLPAEEAPDSSTLNEAAAKAVNIASSGCPKVDMEEPGLAKAIDFLDHELAAAARDGRGNPEAANLLPLTLRAMRNAHLGIPLLARRREDRLEVEITPVPSTEMSVVVLDATATEATAEILKKIFVGFEMRLNEPLALVRPAGAKVIQYLDRSYARATLKTPAQVATAARIVCAAIRLHVPHAIAQPKVALISFKDVVAPLAEEITKADESLQVVGSLYFGALVGKNDLQDCDVLVVLGTPRLHPAGLDVIAMSMASSADALNAARGKVGPQERFYKGKRTRVFRSATEGIYCTAEKHTIESELKQAIGRKRLARKGGIVLVFSSWGIEENDIEARKAREDGFDLDPRFLAAFEAFEKSLLDGLTNVVGEAGLTRAEIATVTHVAATHLDRYLPLFLTRHSEFLEVGKGIRGSPKRLVRRG